MVEERTYHTASNVFQPKKVRAGVLSLRHSSKSELGRRTKRNEHLENCRIKTLLDRGTRVTDSPGGSRVEKIQQRCCCPIQAPSICLMKLGGRWMYILLVWQRRE